MTRSIFAVVTIALALVVAGCGDSRESLASESVSTMKELVATLDTVKDVDTAKAAKPKLKSLIAELDDLNKRGEKLGMPSKPEIDSLDSKYGKEMEDLQQKMVGHMFRLMGTPGVQAELNDINFKK